jgi:hypothetical protein
MGWPVFPLKAGEKTPLIPKAKGGNGVHDATTDPAQIRRWWTACPNANIGLATMPFWVLDVDQPDGPDVLSVIITRFGALPETMMQVTGSGGLQFFFAADPRVRNGVKFLPGLDTRAAGGYVVAPPSVHPCGDAYQWEDGHGPNEIEIATAPEWLVRLAEPLEMPQAEPPSTVRPTAAPGRYGAAALEAACEVIARAPVGSQADTLDRQAYGIGRLVAGGELERRHARGELIAAGCRMANAPRRRPWTRNEIQFRVDRAFAQAAHRPRTAEARAC